MTAPMPFAGKWQFANASGQTITVDSHGALALAAADGGALSQMLNAYGDVAGTNVWMQAGNGLYLSAASGAVAVANQPRDGAVALLAAEPVNDQFRLRRRSSSGDSYLVASGTTLSWQPVTANPPAGALFNRTIVTAGLADLKAFGAMGADLRFAFLAGENLARLVMMGAALSDADLHGCTLTSARLVGTTIDRANFTGCDLSAVDFSGATGSHVLFDDVTFNASTLLSGTTLPNASFRRCNSHGTAVRMNNLSATAADFTGARLAYAVMNHADLSKATLLDVDLSHASLSTANFTQALMSMVNLQNTTLQTAIFVQASLPSANFTGADINDVNFAQANLTNAALSKVTGAARLNLSDTLLLAATMTGMDLRDATLTAQTNFTQAKMDGVNLTAQTLDRVVFQGASLKQAKFDNTSLNDAVLVGADLTGASITGNVSMVGANFSNASLARTDITGGQFGSLQTIGQLDAHAAAQLDLGQMPDTLHALEHQGQAVLNTRIGIQVTTRLPGEDWLVEQGDIALRVRRQQDGQLAVMQSTGNAAILTNVFMPDAILTGANLYAVDMSGAQWYGSLARAENANLEQVNLSGANLATMTFTQARMFGANLSYANLVNADFSKANLDPTQGQKPASLAFASLQGTIFTAASLAGANLTNAAVALVLPNVPTRTIGTPLFPMDPALAASLDTGVLSSSVRQAFIDHGYPLVSAAKLTVQEKTQRWLINNTPPSTDLVTRGYTQFMLVMDTQAGRAFIQTSGSPPLRVIRTTDGNALQPVTVAYGETLGLAQAMNGETTCPSGLRYKMLGNGISYEALMTPGQPPHPPKCVPSPDQWCT